MIQESSLVIDQGEFIDGRGPCESLSAQELDVIWQLSAFSTK